MAGTLPGQIKLSLTGIAAAVAAFVEPVLPAAFLCAVMVIIDLITALTLSRRLRRAGKAQGKISSRRLGMAIVTIVKIWCGLLVAQGIRIVMPEGLGWGDPVHSLTGAVCFWQLMSILENESTCSNARWARAARRFLADKTGRHIN